MTDLFRSFTRVLTLIMVVGMTAPAFAVSIAEGMAAYKTGDYAGALEILRPLAENGNAEAQLTIGIMYEHGQGMNADPEEALRWYHKAGEQGIATVQHDLGVKYYKGLSVARNETEAARWWRKAASQGLAESQFNLGLLYLRGEGVVHDDEEAMYYFTEAATQGHADAQYSLAVMLAFGQGTAKNYPEALKWFTKASVQGVAAAQFNLGVLYEFGRGVEPDPAQARVWYKRAADQGLTQAQTQLVAMDKADALTDKPRTIAASKPVPAPAPVAAPVAKVAPKTVVATSGSWLDQQDPAHFTLQLLSGRDGSAIDRFMRQHGIADNANKVKVNIKGNTWFSIAYGSYATRVEAKAAVATLPASLAGKTPWIRTISTLQKIALP